MLDPTGKIAGRGAYLCADGSCWRTAATRGSVARALGVRLPDELEARLAAGPTMTIEPTDSTKMMTQGGARGQE